MIEDFFYQTLLFFHCLFEGNDKQVDLTNKNQQLQKSRTHTSKKIWFTAAQKSIATVSLQ